MPGQSVGHCGMATPVSTPSTRPQSHACDTAELVLGALALCPAMLPCSAVSPGVRVGHGVPVSQPWQGSGSCTVRGWWHLKSVSLSSQTSCFNSWSCPGFSSPPPDFIHGVAGGHRTPVHLWISSCPSAIRAGDQPLPRVCHGSLQDPSLDSDSRDAAVLVPRNTQPRHTAVLLLSQGAQHSSPVHCLSQA